MCTGQHSQHLCPFLHIKVILTEEDKFLMVLRDGRGVDNESGVLILACMGNLVYIFFIMNQHPFFFQLGSEGRRCLVVACHYKAAMYEIAGDGTHSYTTGTYEIY